MATSRYVWRQLTAEQRVRLLDWRKKLARPWHSPPHRRSSGASKIHVSASCYEHVPHIGFSVERMSCFSSDLLCALAEISAVVHSWCVLPNHYHALVESDAPKLLFQELGRLHGRASFAWNTEEDTRGRKVFYRASDRGIRTERHFWATMNYLHNNPVHHGYVKRWTEWPWSSAHEFIDRVGREEAERIWRDYPLRDFGAKWDSANV